MNNEDKELAWVAGALLVVVVIILIGLLNIAYSLWRWL